MMELTGVIGIFVVIYILMGIKIVPQTQNYLINRLGKYNRTLSAGPHWIFPIYERVHSKPHILERTQPFEQLSAYTKDNAEVYVESTCFWRMLQPENTIYRIVDIDKAVEQSSLGAIRAAFGGMDLDDVLSKREDIKNTVKAALADATSDWGIEITRTEITNIDFPPSVKKSMEKQVAAERQKRETILRAEADKQDVMLRSDAELYEAGKQAEAQKITADAQAYAVTTVAEAIKNNGQEAVKFEIAKGQIGAIEKLGTSTNSKLVVLPTDVTATLGGLSAVMEVLKTKE